MSDVVRWLAEQGVTLAVCQNECSGTYTQARSRRCQARNSSANGYGLRSNPDRP